MISLRLLIVFNITLVLFSCAPYSLPGKKEAPQREFAFKYYQKSLLALNQNKLDDAAGFIRRAIEINPNFAKFYSLQGDILYAQDRKREAINSYQLALRKRSNFAEMYIKSGRIYEELDLPDQAIQEYRKAIAVEEDHVYLLLKIAELYLNVDDVYRAQSELDDFEKYLKKHKQEMTVAYYQLRGKCLLKQNQPQKALEQFYLAESIDGKNFLTRFMLARLYFQLGNIEKGITYINSLLQQEKNNGELYHYRGVYYYRKQNLKDARTQFLLALQMDNKLVEPLYFLGKIEFKSGNRKKASDYWNRYLQSDISAERRAEVRQLLREADTPGMP